MTARGVLAIACCAVGIATVDASAAGGPVPPVLRGTGAVHAASDMNYVAMRAGRDTLVAAIRHSDGAVQRTRLLKGRFGVPGVAWDGSTTGVSDDGQTLVLSDYGTARRTRLAVLDTERLKLRDTFDLRGYFTVDAIAPDARWLYLIQYRGRNGLDYAVRAYDLERGRLVAEPIVDPTEPDEKMAGVPLTRAMSADGRWAYTLYDRPEGEPFIHALDTAGRTARCIDLDDFAPGDMAEVRFAVGKGTLRLERSGVPVAVVDTQTFKVSEPAPAAPAATPAPVTTPREETGGFPWLGGAIAAAVLAAFAVAAATTRRRRTTH